MKTEKVKNGDLFATNQGCVCIVVDYQDSKNVRVRFLDKFNHEVIARLDHLRSGKVRNPYHPSLFGVGFVGVGDFKASENGKDTKEYTTWYNMMKRCYSREFLDGNPTYEGCKVCDEWHNFQSFAEWLTKQKNWGKAGYDLDKDLKIIGNKVYGPDFCSLVPHEVNSVLGRKTFRKKKEEAPDGVSWDAAKRKYIAQCWNGNGKNIHIGRFDCKFQAHDLYKKFKERIVREVADRFKEDLDVCVYVNLSSYRLPEALDTP